MKHHEEGREEEKAMMTQSQQAVELLKQVETRLQIAPTEQEVDEWKKWLRAAPVTDFDQPLQVTSLRECIAYLPPLGNPTTDRFNLFFKGEFLLNAEKTETILYEVAKKELNYEISVIRHSTDTISIGIGGRVRNPSTLFGEGEYVGHYHPLGIDLERPELLPELFIKGLIPSPGDVKSYIKFPEAIKDGTIIVSPFGSVAVRSGGQPEYFDASLEEYRCEYLKLFLGKSSLAWKTERDVRSYFRQSFGLELTFSLSVTE